MIELIDVRHVRQYFAIDVDERKFCRDTNRVEHRIQQHSMILAVTIPVPQRFPRALGNVSPAPEFDGLVMQLLLHVTTDCLYLPAVVSDTTNKAFRHLRNTARPELVLNLVQIFFTCHTPVRARCAQVDPR